jgi:hypothetical protein
MDADKRILGFAGGASSMHYVVHMEEKLVHAPHKLTVKPAEKPIIRTAEAPTSTGSANSPSARNRSTDPDTQRR